jgi:hypothetical protein
MSGNKSSAYDKLLTQYLAVYATCFEEQNIFSQLRFPITIVLRLSISL